MENIRPSADLRNKYNEIAKLCKDTKEPVYITVNGRGDTVLLSMAEYKQKRGRLLKMLEIKMFRRASIFRRYLINNKSFEENNMSCPYLRTDKADEDIHAIINAMQKIPVLILYKVLKSTRMLYSLFS